MSDHTTHTSQSKFHLAPLCQCGCGQPVSIAKSATRQARYLPGHHAKSLKIPFAERFWSHVDKRGPDDCWLWQAATVKGYGKFKGDDRKMLAAHRVAYELTYGPIPDEMLCCHTCDTPLCCNPAHLFAGTPKDNTQDMVQKGRKGDVKGEKHGRHILTKAQVREIRQRYAQGGTTHDELGQEYGVAGGTVANIVSGNKWTHVDGPITRSRVNGKMLRGHKLTMDDAREIRRLYAAGEMFQREIGEKYGISQSNVGLIIRDVIWRED